MTDDFWSRGPLRRALYYSFGRWLSDVVERLRLHGARVLIKSSAAVGIVAFTLFIFLPMEIKGWSLWLIDKEYASHIALGVVGVALLCGMLVKYAKDAGRKDMVLWGTVLAILCFTVSVASGWNFLLHEQNAARAQAAQAQALVISGPSGQDQLAAFDTETAAMLATLRQALAEAPANAPTARARLTAQVTAYIQQRSTERVALVASIDAAQARSAEAAPRAVDPRPLDGVIAAALPGDRDFWGIILDLLRVLFVKATVFWGLGLALTISPEVRREADKKAAAAERAKAQPRKGGKWAAAQRPRLVDLRPAEDPDPTTPAPTTPGNAAVVGALMEEVVWLMGAETEQRAAG